MVNPRGLSGEGRRSILVYLLLCFFAQWWCVLVCLQVNEYMIFHIMLSHFVPRIFYQVMHPFVLYIIHGIGIQTDLCDGYIYLCF